MDEPISARTRSKTIEIKNCKPGVVCSDGKKMIYLCEDGTLYECETLPRQPRRKDQKPAHSSSE
jgi:hypothetical protein